MQAVLTDPLSIVTGRVFDANIFHPAAGTLAYSDHLLLQSVVLSPLYALTGDVVLCYNLLLVASLVLSALAMHALVRAVIGSEGGAYLAGLAWGFGTYRFAHLLHLQLQALYFLPLAFLYLHKVVAGRRRRDAIVLGVITGLQAVSSVYYAVIGGVGLIVGGLALVVTRQPPWSGTSVAAPGAGRRRRWRAGHARRPGVLASAAGTGVWTQSGRGRARRGAGQQLPSGARGQRGVWPHRSAACAVHRCHSQRSGPERELFPGVMLVLLALVGIRRGLRSDARPLVIAMCLVGVSGAVLSLGPDGVRCAVCGRCTGLCSAFQAIRAPQRRFSVLVTFALACSARSAGANCRAMPHGIVRTCHAMAADRLLMLAAFEMGALSRPAGPGARSTDGRWGSGCERRQGRGASPVLRWASTLRTPRDGRSRSSIGCRCVNGLQRAASRLLSSAGRRS
jgi:hypothetical protein